MSEEYYMFKILETLKGKPLTYDEKEDIITKKVCNDMEKEYTMRLRRNRQDRYNIDIIYYWKIYDPEMKYFTKRDMTRK